MFALVSTVVPGPIWFTTPGPEITPGLVIVVPAAGSKASVALSATFNVAFSAPVAAGLNFTEIVQLAPAATVAPVTVYAGTTALYSTTLSGSGAASLQSYSGQVALEAFKENFARPMAAQFGALLGSLDGQWNGLEEQMELEGRHIAGCAESSDGREGIDAFLTKRAPKFA